MSSVLKNSNKFFMLSICIVVVFMPYTLHAGSSIRCGNYLISVGDLKIAVLDKCGEPISKEKIELNSRRRGRSDNYRYLEQWIYEFHYGYYDILTFKGGKLVKIDSMVPK